MVIVAQLVADGRTGGELRSEGERQSGGHDNGNELRGDTTRSRHVLQH